MKFRPLGLAAPVLLGAGGVALLSPAPLAVGQALLAAGTGALAVLYVPLWRRQRDEAVLVQALGAVLGAGGALLWLAGLDDASEVHLAGELARFGFRADRVMAPLLREADSRRPERRRRPRYWLRSLGALPGFFFSVAERVCTAASAGS